MIAADILAFNGTVLNMTREETQVWLYLKHSVGRLTIQDNPKEMTLIVKTMRTATDVLKVDLAKYFPGYTITYGKLCKCYCHDPEPKGWEALRCCPDCGVSLCSNVRD